MQASVFVEFLVESVRNHASIAYERSRSRIDCATKQCSQFVEIAEITDKIVYHRIFSVFGARFCRFFERHERVAETTTVLR